MDKWSNGWTPIFGKVNTLFSTSLLHVDGTGWQTWCVCFTPKFFFFTHWADYPKCRFAHGIHLSKVLYVVWFHKCSQYDIEMAQSLNKNGVIFTTHTFLSAIPISLNILLYCLYFNRVQDPIYACLCAQLWCTAYHNLHMYTFPLELGDPIIGRKYNFCN